MTIDEAKAILEETIIFDLRHDDYDKCVEIARKSRIYVTGEGQDDEYLLELRDKETERQKMIRVKVTKPITPFALNPVITEYEKIFRVDGVIKDISHEDKTKDEVLSEKAGKYHANSSISDYFNKRYLHYQFIDPNAWHIVERKNVFEGQGANSRLKDIEIYPFEVSSEEAINYHYENGVEKWLIVMQPRIERTLSIDGGKENIVHDFYFYGEGVALKYTEFEEIVPPDEIIGELVSFSTVKDSGKVRTFWPQGWETGSKEFTGNKFGCYDDPESDGTVKVPPFWTGARFVLDDLIQTKSSFDVSKYNHVFPKLFHYDINCDYDRETESGDYIRCQGGYLDNLKTMPCPKCNGSAGQIHISESDVVTFEMPNDPNAIKDLPPLSNLAYYHSPPLDVTEAIWQWINTYIERVYLASFNASYFEQGEAQKTAFESAKIWDAKNTRIYPCAVHLSRMYEKTGRIIAQYTESDTDGLNVRHFVPHDMKLEPLDVLIQRYEKAKAAGLPYDIIYDIQCGILSKSMLDDPEKVAEIKAWQFWKPFKSMTSEEVQMLLVTRAEDDHDRVLWENWDKVQRVVNEALNGTYFAPLPTKKQKELIGAAIEQVSSEIKTKEVETPDMGFPVIEEEEDEEIETS